MARSSSPIPWSLARWQLPVVGSFLRLVTSGRRPGRRIPSTPGPELISRFAPRAPKHVRAYLAHVGAPADGSVVPPHLFPHWCLALTGRLVGRLPLSMMSAVNAGCDVRVHAPLPADEPLVVRGWLERVDVGERRTLVVQRFVTSTPSAPDALEVDITLLVRTRSPRGAASAGREPERVPAAARAIARLDLDELDGLRYATLTGDFNPLHWSPRYARALGFSNTILQGFATASRAWVALEADAGRPLARFSCRFPRPVVLPARLAVYAGPGEVYVGARPGDEARLVGTFEPAKAPTKTN